MNDFNQQVVLAAAGTSYSDVYQLSDEVGYVDASVEVLAIAGTGPSLVATVQVSHDKVSWTDASILPTFSAIGKKETRLTQPRTWFRIKLVLAGTTPSATVSLFALGKEGDGDAGDGSEYFRFLNGVNSTLNGNSMDVRGMATVAVQISGTFVGTVYFEGSIDDTNWNPLFAVKLGSGTIGSSTTTTGLYRLAVAGLKSIRTRLVWTSGTSLTSLGKSSVYSSSTEDAAFARLMDKLAGEDIDRDLMLNLEMADRWARITSAATTPIMAEGGSLMGVYVEATTTGTITVYDSPASASGTILTILPIGTTQGFHKLPIPVASGVTVVTSAADRCIPMAHT